MFVGQACDCHPFHHSKRRWLITDFGFAMSVDGDKIVYSHGRRGTDAYRSPELIEDGEASKKTDIWALGCILYRVAVMDSGTFKDPCLPRSTADGVLRLPAILEIPQVVVPPQNSSPQVQQLNSILKLCFAREPRERPTAAELKIRFEDMRSALLDSKKAPSLQGAELSNNADETPNEWQTEISLSQPVNAE
jgi:serine/threonine protein kinase